MDEDTPAERPSQAPRLVARAEADEEPRESVSARPKDVAPAQPPKSAARVDRTTEDDLLATQTFFSQPPAEHAPEAWDSAAPTMPASSRRAMYAAVSIFSVSLLLLCGYLIYTRLLMPVPAQLGKGSGMPAAVALPPVAQAEPAAVAPAPAPSAALAAPPPVPAAPAPAAPAPIALEPTTVVAAAAPLPTDPAAAAAATAAVSPAAAVEPAPVAVTPPPPPTGEVAELLKSADALYKRNKFKQARAAYEQVLAADPNAPEALSRTAFLDLQAGDNEKAKQFAARAVEVDPTSSEGWIVLGAALESLKDRTGARAAYAKCAELGTGAFVRECKRLAR